MGRQVVAELQRRGQPFVVIERDPAIAMTLVEADILHLLGDATHDGALIAAGIERAKGFVSTLDSDADNILAVLTAKGLKPDVAVVTRASSEEAERKLKRAGADRVVSPYTTGGFRVALALMRPRVNDFLNMVVHDEVLNIEMGEITLSPTSEFIGSTLRTSGLRQRWQAIVLAIYEIGGQVTIAPDPNYRLRAGDTLIVVAPIESLRQLESE
jgi:voltage-gated potassium channel